MKEIISNVNLFRIAKENTKGRTAVVVTTNGMTKANGDAVMGAGIAKYAAQNLSPIDRSLLSRFTGSPCLSTTTLPNIMGKMLRIHSNQAFYLGRWDDKVTDYTTHLLTMPTKWDWRNDSDLELIKTSCRQMIQLADINELETIFLPAPGCNNGHLSFAEVGPAISVLLDDRFLCVRPAM